MDKQSIIQKDKNGINFKLVPELAHNSCQGCHFYNKLEKEEEFRCKFLELTDPIDKECNEQYIYGKHYFVKGIKKKIIWNR